MSSFVPVVPPGPIPPDENRILDPSTFGGTCSGCAGKKRGDGGLVGRDAVEVAHQLLPSSALMGSQFGRPASPIEVWPDFGRAPAAGSAGRAGLDVRQPKFIGPMMSAERDRYSCNLRILTPYRVHACAAYERIFLINVSNRLSRSASREFRIQTAAKGSLPTPAPSSICKGR
jgi:hypothetical protein